MSIGTSEQRIPSAGYADWKVVGSTDYQTGTSTYKVYGSSGRLLAEGTVDEMVEHFTVTAPSNDRSSAGFYQQIADKITSMNEVVQGSLAQLMEQDKANAAQPATVTDTAANNVTNTSAPAQVASTPTTPSEQANLAKNSNPTPGNDYGSAIQQSIQNEANSQAGEGKVIVGKPTITNGTIEFDPDAIDLSSLVSNPLHEYASYTYGLSLHLLTAKEYNDIVNKGTYKPNRVLIASAGRYNNTPGPDQFIRSPKFAEDFYFEKFEMETVIGLNAESRSSNSIKYDFTIIEPYGFTLIDRIIDLCSDPDEGVNCKNYLDMPYLLQIDFFGIDDTGTMVGAIPSTTKRIPIRLNKLHTRISARGAEYTIQGTTYNHSAYDMTTISTPINVEVQARTVAEFFQGGLTGGDPSAQSTEREGSENSLYSTSDGSLVQNGQFVPLNTVNPSLLSLQTKRQLGLVKSYGTAINKFYKQAFVDNKIGVNDEYYFNFVDSEIANSPFTSGPLTNPKDTGMVAMDQTNSIHKSNNGNNTNDYDPNLRIFQVNAGTYIDQVIAWVIRNSKWMTDQVVVPDGADPKTYLEELKAKKDTPLYWFKVIPSIELGEFDNRRNVWSRKITYHIQKYEVMNVKVDVGPDARAVNPVKSYNYMYTGKNDDILDLDIEFNALYYNALTIYRSATSNVVPPPTASELALVKNPDGYTGTSDPEDPNPNAIMPLVNKIQVIDARARTGSGSNSAKQVSVADLEASLMTLSRADMMHVKLKILGDPTFIKQDDVFWTPKSTTQNSEISDNADPRLTPDGSLKTDKGEVRIALTFRTPTDIDESTGMMNHDAKSNKTKISLFSGLYRVMTITNEFRHGLFTQTLNLVRLVKQGKLDNKNKAPKTDNRNILPNQSATANPSTQGADVTSPDKSASTSSTDDAAQSAQQQQAGGNNQAPNNITKEQKDLKDVKDTASEVPITQNNEPQQTQPLQSSISFKEAFNRARAANGGQPGAQFEWNGAMYQTNVVGEAYIEYPTIVQYDRTP